MVTNLQLFTLPLEAKRVDQHHAVIYDATGALIAKMAGSELSYDRAVALTDAINFRAI